MLFFSVIPGSMGTTSVDLNLQNTMSVETRIDFNITILGEAQLPTQERGAPISKVGCGGLCGIQSPSQDANQNTCWCDNDCREFNDCCTDYQRFCESSKRVNSVDSCMFRSNLTHFYSSETLICNTICTFFFICLNITRCGHRFDNAAPTFLRMNEVPLSFFSGYITFHSIDEPFGPSNRYNIGSMYSKLVTALLDAGFLEMPFFLLW